LSQFRKKNKPHHHTPKEKQLVDYGGTTVSNGVVPAPVCCHCRQRRGQKESISARRQFRPWVSQRAAFLNSAFQLQSWNLYTKVFFILLKLLKTLWWKT